MGVAIQCILERNIPGIPHMEGKSLAMAYCGDPGGREPAGATDADGDVIVIDFGGSKAQGPTPPESESLFAPLDAFIAADGSSEWHDASKGLAAVRAILTRFREGATVTLAPDFEFGFGDDAELTEGVRYDLEELEQILDAAQKARSQFYLAFDA
jgi:hypothetical protein